MSPASHLVADLALSEFFGRAEHFGVDSWPPVLDMHGADRDVAHDDTDSHSYLGEVPPDVEEWVNSAIEVLAVPDEYLEIRKVSAGRVARACAARRSGRSILATRIAGRIRLEELIIDSVADLSAPIVGVIGEVRAAAFGAFSVPAGELVETLAQESVDAPSPRAALDALRSLGAQAVDAAIVAAFVECRCRTEIVAVAMADGRTARSAGGLAVFDTAHGRILAAPGTASDGRLWLTFMPGTGHRIGQALGLLAETLPDPIGPP